jgi:hypothetical protein
MRTSFFVLLLLPTLAHAQAPPLTFISPNPEQTGGFGLSVSGVEDADGDGRGDLLAGAYYEDGGAFNAGRVYLFSGATGALLRTLTSPNPEFQGYFGFSVAGVADADGDGRGDLLVGAYSEAGGATDAGRAYLFPSGTSISLTATGNPTTIAPGGTVMVRATITNYTAQPAPLDLWVVVTRNGNPVLTQLIVSVTVPAGVTVPISFALRSPRNTPPGTYTVNVNVGTFPNTVVATDAFDVTVTPAPRLPGAVAAETGWSVVEPAAGDRFSAQAPPSVAVSPNPFTGRTAIGFALAEASPVRLSVYDVLGREVAVLVNGELAAGAYAAGFDARGLASGIYVWRLEAGSAVQAGRLTLLE